MKKLSKNIDFKDIMNNKILSHYEMINLFKNFSYGIIFINSLYLLSNNFKNYYYMTNLSKTQLQIAQGIILRNFKENIENIEKYIKSKKSLT